jgi:hypothetical protein
MDRQAPQRAARFLLAAFLLGLLLSQPGHAVAYFLQYGPRSLALETHGVHSYFPSVLGLSAAFIGAGAVGALLLLALARLLVGRALALRRGRGVSFLALFAVLALVQVDVYVGQEALEAGAVGEHFSALTMLGILGWGLLGQVPLAALAATALYWLSSPLRAALQALGSPFSRVLRLGFIVDAARVVLSAGEPSRQIALAQAFPSAFRKRGPPRLLLS